MKLKLALSVLLLLFSCLLIQAQGWSKEDSIWIKNVLEGKEELKINEETKKAIEEGRLIAPSRLKDADFDLELSKDFDNTGVPDSVKVRRIDPYSMPPSVYALYILYLVQMDSVYQIQSIFITDDERKQLEKMMSIGPSSLFIPDGYFPGGRIGGDFNHALSMIFSASYRQKMKNRKNATAYKNYYDSGFTRSIQITDRERKQMNNSINNIRPTGNFRTGQRRGGIDD